MLGHSFASNLKRIAVLVGLFLSPVPMVAAQDKMTTSTQLVQTQTVTINVNKLDTFDWCFFILEKSPMPVMPCGGTGGPTVIEDFGLFPGDAGTYTESWTCSEKATYRWFFYGIKNARYDVIREVEVRQYGGCNGTYLGGSDLSGTTTMGFMTPEPMNCPTCGGWHNFIFNFLLQVHLSGGSEVTGNDVASPALGMMKKEGCRTCDLLAGILGMQGLPTYGFSYLHSPKTSSFYTNFGPGFQGLLDSKIYVYSSNPYYTDAVFFDGLEGKPYKLTHGYMHPTGELKDVTTNAFESLKLYNASNQPTNDPSQASTATLTHYNGIKLKFQIIKLNNGSGYSGDYAGRLTRIERADGYGIDVTYKTFTQQEITSSPTRQWQIDTVTDAYGDVHTFTYGAQTVSGRWVVSSIATPASQTISFNYDADGFLSAINYPDSTQATFSRTVNTTDGTTTVESFEPHAADPTLRRISSVFSLDYKFFEWDEIQGLIAQPPGQLVSISNGNDEEIVHIYPSPSDPAAFKIVQGPTLAEVKVGQSVRYYHAGWAHTYPQQGYNGFTGTLEPTYSYSEGHGLDGTPTRIVREDGVSFDLLWDTASRLTKLTNTVTGEFESWTYNSLGRVTRYRDADGRVTKATYDTVGNVTQVEVGIKEVNGVDQNQAEYAVYRWEYYAAGHAHQRLLKTVFSGRHTNEADIYRTDYEYHSDHHLHKIIGAASATGQSRPNTVLTWDTAGRLSTITDPVGRMNTYTYDSMSRVVETLYGDGSTVQNLYAVGSSDDAGLVIKVKDRSDTVSELSYDLSSRVVESMAATAIDVDILDGNPDDTPITQAYRQSRTEIHYITGTSMPDWVRTEGKKSSLTYDYRGRTASTTILTSQGHSLTGAVTYVNNRLVSETDPFGRMTYYGYDTSRGEVIRTISTAVSGISYADNAAILAATRGTGPNPTIAIVDVVRDAMGSPTQTQDPLGTISKVTRDSIGRTTSVVAGFGLSVEAKIEQLYDDDNHVVESRSPRYFDNADAAHADARATATYDGAGRLAGATSAPGSSIAGSISKTYLLDGRPSETTDARGSDWETLWHSCCGLPKATIDPLGHGALVNYDLAGRSTHQAAVADVLTHTNNFNPIDNKTLAEVTTRYDELGRVIATTRWGVARGTVDPNAPPIAGWDGVSAADGLTTRIVYDTNLADGVGLDSSGGISVAQLGGGSVSVNLVDCLAKLASSEAQGGANTTFSSDAAGSGAIVIDAQGRYGAAIADAAGRVVFRAILNPPGSGSALAPLLWSSVSHDHSATISGYGSVVETRSINAAGHVSKVRVDGLGRVLQTENALGAISVATYDSAGNVLSMRDPNGVGADLVYDALGRVTSVTDTQGDTTSRTYNRAGNVVSQTDGKGVTSYVTYDARGRVTQTTDRLGLVTSFSYDAGSLQTGMLDAEGKQTTWAYDVAGRPSSITFPGHASGTTPGQSGYDRITAERDALGRVFRSQDQIGNGVTLNFNLLGQMTGRDYRTLANWPSGTVSSSDTFNYDASGRLTSAVSGRYSNTTSYAYDSIGRKSSETLSYGGANWAVGTEYDLLGRAYRQVQPGGNTIERTFTALGQLYETKRNGTTLSTRTYDAGGRLTQEVLGNGVTETWTYRADNQVASISVSGIETRTYSYDVNKNVTGETITGPLSGYGWSVPTNGRDANDRLVAWNRTDGNNNRSWTLSSVGNQLTSVINGTSEARTYGNVHQPLSVGGASLSYDSRGQLTEDRAGREYTWDISGLLASVDVDGNGSEDVEYLYDALGRKIGRTESGATRIQVQSGWQTIAEFDTTAPTVAVESYAHGAYIDEPIQKVGTGGSIYYHHDRRFSTSALSDSSGNAVERYGYSMHGSLTLFDGSGSSRSSTLYANFRMYTGAERDKSTGQDYLRNRWFEAEIGFTSRDPLGYVDGASVYLGYFGDGGFDPWGLEDGWWSDENPSVFQGFMDGYDIGLGRLNHFIWIGRHNGHTLNDMYKGQTIDDDSARGACKALMQGQITGGKAAVNGLAQAGVNFITLGTYEGQVVVIPVNDLDRFAGYDTAVMFSTASGEILISLTPAQIAKLKDVASLASHAQKIDVAVDAINGVDAAGNAIQLGGAVGNCANGEAALGDGVVLVAAAFGMAQNLRTCNRLDAPGNPADVADDIPLAAPAPATGEIPPVIYREGRPSPSNLTPRPQDNGHLSFRDSLSNPIQPGTPGPLGGERAVLRPGEDYIAIDTSSLPPGSVVPDGVPGSLQTPPGHVSVVNVPPDVLRNAVIPRPPTPPHGPGASGRFPK